MPAGRRALGCGALELQREEVRAAAERPRRAAWVLRRAAEGLGVHATTPRAALDRAPRAALHRAPRAALHRDGLRCGSGASISASSGASISASSGWVLAAPALSAYELEVCFWVAALGVGGEAAGVGGEAAGVGGEAAGVGGASFRKAAVASFVSLASAHVFMLAPAAPPVDIDNPPCGCGYACTLGSAYDLGVVVTVISLGRSLGSSLRSQASLGSTPATISWA